MNIVDLSGENDIEMGIKESSCLDGCDMLGKIKSIKTDFEDNSEIENETENEECSLKYSSDDDNYIADDEKNIYYSSTIINTPSKKEEDQDMNDACFKIDNKFIEILENNEKEDENENENENKKILRRMKSFSFKNSEIADDIITNNIDDFWEANSESEDESGDESLLKEKKKVPQLSFDKLKSKIYKDFDVNLIHKYSSALDIMASYIKYHVIIYTEACYYCNFMLNLFMLPSILFSTVCSVIAGITHNNGDMAIIVASLNGFIAFLLAIINYLKLDASAEAHKISAYQYSKLKNYIEFSSGEILLFQDPIISNKDFISEQINIWDKQNEFNNNLNLRKDKIKELYLHKGKLEKKLIDTIQKKIFEIKKTLKNIEDNNNFILPKHINRRYCNIYNINVFSYIKSVESYKLVILNELRNVKNEIRFYKSNLRISEHSDRIKELYIKKNNILNEFLELNKGFMLIDTMFQQEIRNINLRKKYWYIFYLQDFISCLGRCCGHKRRCFYILPSGYKKCTQIGFKDTNNKYLLDKILHTTNN
tara:strand:- start:2792 stop:4405 length:1614 start_codon:yes stop_codon:yes gene_type:complete